MIKSIIIYSVGQKGRLAPVHESCYYRAMVRIITAEKRQDDRIILKLNDTSHIGFWHVSLYKTNKRGDAVEEKRTSDKTINLHMLQPFS